MVITPSEKPYVSWKNIKIFINHVHQHTYIYPDKSIFVLLFFYIVFFYNFFTRIKMSKD